MKRLYPSVRHQPSFWRLRAVVLIGILILGWITFALIYSFLYNEPRWLIYASSFLGPLFMVAIVLAHSFWPVISIDGQAFTQHRRLWLPRHYQIEEIDSVSKDGQVLYVKQSGRKHAIDIGRLSEDDREVVRHMAERTDLENAG